MADTFSTAPRRLDSPAASAVLVVPSDTVGIDTPRSIYVGGAGDLKVRMAADGVDVTFRNVAAGSVLPIRPSFIRATGTTATGILALS